MTRRAAAGGSRLAAARRVVVKVGSALLVEQSTGSVNRAWLESLAEDIAALRAARPGGRAGVLGRHRARPARARPARAASRSSRRSRPRPPSARSASRTPGRKCSSERGFTVAQVLLTLGDTEERRRYLNARNTLTTLLRLGAIPVINENDTVATAEIRYGDNDRLAARVAQMVSADCLVLLSDVDGLYTADPTREPGARVHPGGAAHHAGDRGHGRRLGVGRRARAAWRPRSMAAQDRGRAPAATCASPPGAKLHPLRRIEAGARCTWFVAEASPVAVRKQWIAGMLKPAGELAVDEGAVRALRGRQEPAAGRRHAVKGRFDRGDAVVVRDPDGLEIARGLAAYSSTDAERIRGRRSSELEALLGFRGRDEMIHRDDLVLVVTDAGHRSADGADRARGAWQAAQALALATTGAEERGPARRRPRRCARRAGEILAANARDMKAARGRGPGRRDARPAAARRDARRGHGAGRRADRGAGRSGRHRDRRMDAAERPAHPARARAARRDRHHLREPART